MYTEESDGMYTVKELIGKLSKLDEDMVVKVMKPQEYSAIYYDLVDPNIEFDEIDGEECLVLAYE